MYVWEIIFRLLPQNFWFELSIFITAIFARILWVILAYENQRFIPQNFWFKLLLDTIHTDTQYEIDTVGNEE